MSKTVTSAQMKKIDRLAQEKYGMPSIILMENAGRASAEEILKRFRKGKGAIFCGKGNNGGDGFVCARYLANAGLKTTVFLLGKSSEVKNKDPLINLTILKKIGTKIKEIQKDRDIENIKRDFRYNFIVDAIFGIGFKGILPEKIKNLIGFLNNTHKPIYSLDAPSGMDVTRGKTQGACIRARQTITFGLPKKGFFNEEARPYIGRLVVKDIGFPIALLK